MADQEQIDPNLLHETGTKILQNLKDVEIDPKEVDLIWDLHPLKLSREQRAVLVEQIRRNREKYQAKKAGKKAGKAYVPVEGDLSLDDLDLGDL